jgi:mannose/fructose-specific phosphotransferase system component IIA
MFGGTPQISPLGMERSNVEVIAGVNLPAGEACERAR